jgi:hypothetical protein
VQAHDLVGDRAQLLARAGVGDGQADDHAGRVLQTHRPDGGDHRLADRRALVDEDDGAPGELGRRAIAAVVAVHAREDAALLGVNGLDPVGGDVQCLHDPLFRTRVPPVATAPNERSSSPGRRSLRTTKTSSGASSSRATSAATAPPPRGRPRTTTPSRPA